MHLTNLLRLRDNIQFRLPDPLLELHNGSDGVLDAGLHETREVLQSGLSRGRRSRTPGCVKKPIPDPGGPNVRAHSWHIGLWPRQLPTARSGKEEKQTFRNIAQLLLWTLFLMSHLFCSHYFRSLHTIQNSRFSWDSNWDRQSRPLDHHHHHGP